MKQHTLIRRTRILAALWLLALAAIASADRAESACPLSSQQTCPSQQDDHDCAFELFRITAVPLRLQSGSPGGLPGQPKVDVPTLAESIPRLVPVANTPHRSTRDILIVAPKTSPPLFA